MNALAPSYPYVIESADYPAVERVLRLGEGPDAPLATLTTTSSGLQTLFTPHSCLSLTPISPVSLRNTAGRCSFDLVAGVSTGSTTSGTVNAYGLTVPTSAVSVVLSTPLGITWSHPTVDGSPEGFFVGTYRPVPGGSWIEMAEPVTVTYPLDASVELTGYFTIGSPLVHCHTGRSMLLAVIVDHRRASEGPVRSVATGVGPALAEHERWSGILRGTNLRSVKVDG
jgi:hypothetical protein